MEQHETAAQAFFCLGWFWRISEVISPRNGPASQCDILQISLPRCLYGRRCQRKRMQSNVPQCHHSAHNCCLDSRKLTIFKLDVGTFLFELSRSSLPAQERSQQNSRGMRCVRVRVCGCVGVCRKQYRSSLNSSLAEMGGENEQDIQPKPSILYI